MVRITLCSFRISFPTRYSDPKSDKNSQSWIGQFLYIYIKKRFLIQESPSFKAEYFGICPRQGNPISLVLVLSRKNTVAGAENKTVHSFFERHPRVWRYFLFCCFEDKFTYQLSPALFRMIVLKAVLSNSNLRPSIHRAICGLPSKQQLWGFGRGIKQSDPRSKGTNFLIQSSDSILL